MTDIFAKLFEFEDIGQVLVTLDSGDEGPEISIRVSVASGFQISGYEDNSKGWNTAEDAFQKISKEDIHPTAAGIIKSMLGRAYNDRS